MIMVTERYVAHLALLNHAFQVWDALTGLFRCQYEDTGSSPVSSVFMKLSETDEKTLL